MRLKQAFYKFGQSTSILIINKFPLYHLKYEWKPIDHFRVALNLIIKARLSAKFLLWKSVFMHMQTKLLFHFESFSLSLVFIMRFAATQNWPIILIKTMHRSLAFVMKFKLGNVLLVKVLRLLPSTTFFFFFFFFFFFLSLHNFLRFYKTML